MAETSQKTKSQKAKQAKAEAKKTAQAEATFHKVQNAHASYSVQLRHVARQIARIIEHFAPPEGGQYALADLMRLRDALAKYSDALRPWATATAKKMLAEVNRRDRSAWETYTRGMSASLRQEIRSAPVGAQMQQLLGEQVELITSLPIDAAQRVQEWSTKALLTSARYPDRIAQVKAELAEAHPFAAESWLKNRATLIARTETARAASVLVQSRATYIGAESYIWETAHDWKVRPSHKRLNGSVHTWSTPPLSDPPDHHSHPGQIFNCRCVALPIIPGG